ncbi:MAG TPA: histidinol-phosphatase, partial [Bacteroidales bacterium]|nr:histidinol-phosphatase [Bacteroidales bacterium]
MQDVNQVDLKGNEIKLGKYIDSLKKFASESDKLDTFSKCKLYNETNFEIDDLANLKTLIKATETLIENEEYKSIVNLHISEDSLKTLIIDLINKHNELYESNLKKLWLNEL